MNLFLLLLGIGLLFICICTGIAILRHSWFDKPVLNLKEPELDRFLEDLSIGKSLSYLDHEAPPIFNAEQKPKRGGASESGSEKASDGIPLVGQRSVQRPPTKRKGKKK